MTMPVSSLPKMRMVGRKLVMAMLDDFRIIGGPDREADGNSDGC